MKKIMKRLASIILMFAVVFCAGISFTGCKNEDKIETYGDFLYSFEYFNEKYVRVAKEKSVKSGIMIRGLSAEGKEKEVVVVPKYINGIKVQGLGSRGYGSDSNWVSEKLKKVFVQCPIFVRDSTFKRCEELEKVILLAHETSAYNFNGSIFRPVFLTSYHFLVEENTTSFYFRDVYHGIDLYFSNVSFLYNYDNSPNDGYYWIDDCNYGSRIEYIPENPVRDEYTFGGWYKEAECINEWSFESDILPQAQYTDEMEEIYQETKLYAKWIKN